MKEMTISAKYVMYESADEMSTEDRELVAKAIEATKTAYTPYSKFNVGAAIRMDNGEIVTGSNQENMAYPSGLCAERTAMFHAAADHPNVAMRTMAIAAVQNGELTPEPVSPCGACRQVMAEYQTRSGKSMEIILVGKTTAMKFFKVDDLLPFIFDSLKV